MVTEILARDLRPGDMIHVKVFDKTDALLILGIRPIAQIELNYHTITYLYDDCVTEADVRSAYKFVLLVRMSDGDV
jgi:hypothetical protein